MNVSIEVLRVHAVFEIGTLCHGIFRTDGLEHLHVTAHCLIGRIVPEPVTVYVVVRPNHQSICNFSPILVDVFHLVYLTFVLQRVVVRAADRSVAHIDVFGRHNRAVDCLTVTYGCFFAVRISKNYQTVIFVDAFLLFPFVKNLRHRIDKTHHQSAVHVLVARCLTSVARATKRAIGLTDHVKLCVGIFNYPTLERLGDQAHRCIFLGQVG